jgi:hypothetical protein
VAEQALTEIKLNQGLSERHAAVLAALRIRLKGSAGKTLEEMLEAADDASPGSLDEKFATSPTPKAKRSAGAAMSALPSSAVAMRAESECRWCIRAPAPASMSCHAALEHPLHHPGVEERGREPPVFGADQERPVEPLRLESDRAEPEEVGRGGEMAELDHQRGPLRGDGGHRAGEPSPVVFGLLYE